MSKNLIIVESPGKIKTLSKFLGKEFIVEASKGHVIDLPPSRFGVSPDNGFVPDFHVVKDRKEVILRLQKLARSVERVYLAPDPDREGEAISWHLANVLNIDPLSECRITFNSITREDVLKSLQHPRPIDFPLVSAQQSRRILDRLVGYKLSPLLWQKICLGLSAGRVQSVAVALICQREKEILAFIPEEFWTIDAELKTSANRKFQVRLVKQSGKKTTVPDKESADTIITAIKKADLTATAVNSRERRQTPPPPFITSTLQAEAAQKFSFTPRRTMSVAQKLYEGVEIGKEGQVGLITYMRTDSVRIAPEGLAELDEYLKTSYSSEYLLKAPRHFKMKKGAQDAHEAIRPTSVMRTPEKMAAWLKPEQLKLYSLIWKRYVASQMAEARYKVVTIDVDVDGNLLQATGTTMVFDGFTSLYAVSREEDEPVEIDTDGKQKLPPVEEGEKLHLCSVSGEQNFTTPPPRYSESSLIKTLEKEGIGRPSTYATIVDTIQQRRYVHKTEGRLQPSDSAFVVNYILEKCFADIINPGFTASMESSLDRIEEGEVDWVHVLSDFYEPFIKDLKKAEAEIDRVQIDSDINCEKCGQTMVVRLGRSGKFLACSGYPACKSTINIPEELLLFANGVPAGPMAMAELLSQFGSEDRGEAELIDEKCDKCGSPMQIRTGRFGRFIACTNYPECKNTRPIVKDSGVACPKPGCGGRMLEKKSKRGRIFYGCSNYPACDLTTWAMPAGELCPECSAPLVWHSTKKSGKFIKCSGKGCKYKVVPESTENDEQEE
ncbi:MAG: type I DNA topoisomerase [Candidatus Riflebacteria bacterium]|nr:type I DNA topoisomerase [Candidatus Riflebacteria bacterium]